MSGETASIKSKVDENSIVTTKEAVLAFDKKEDTVALLKALFRHGYADLSFGTLPGISMQQTYAEMQVALEQFQTRMKDKPSIVHWLRCGLFESTENYIPLAMLLIEWYEQHPPYLESNECNFREIYHFLYKITMNQPVPSLSHGSAKVLHSLISDVIEEVWPSAQNELLNYLSKVYNYSKPINRRMYPGKRASQLSP